MEKSGNSIMVIEDQFGDPAPANVIPAGHGRNCCPPCREMLPRLLELLQMERSEAADREKRFLSRIDQLHTTVKELGEKVESLCDVSAEASSSSIGRKRRKKKQHTELEVDVTGVRTGTESSMRTTYAPKSSRSELNLEESQPSSRSILSLDLPAETSATESSTRTSSAASKQSLPRFEDQPEDDSWQTVSSQKPTGKKAVFFVGNLRNDMQEEDFKTFITKRCLSAGVSVVVHSVKLFSKSDNMSARVIISADGAKLVKSRVFWPAPVCCRAWSFDKYQNSDPSLSNC